MLNSATQNILNSLKDISNTAIISYPKTGIQDIERSIVAFFDVKELGETEFEEFGLMNVTEFLNLISLVDNAEISITDKIATVKNDMFESKYYTTDVSIIQEAYGTNSNILNNIYNAPQSAKFVITQAEIEKLKKTSGFLKLEDLVISESNGQLELKLTDCSKSDTNSFKSIINADIDDPGMNIVIKMDKLKRIPAGNYTVKVAKNPKSGNYVTLWKSNDIASLEIVITIQAL